MGRGNGRDQRRRAPLVGSRSSTRERFDRETSNTTTTDLEIAKALASGNQTVIRQAYLSWIDRIRNSVASGDREFLPQEGRGGPEGMPPEKCALDDIAWELNRNNPADCLCRTGVLHMPAIAPGDEVEIAYTSPSVVTSRREIRYVVRARLNPKSSYKKGNRTVDDLECYCGDRRVYIPGQQGYHAWHQGFADEGYEPPNGVPHRRYRSLDEYNCFDRKRRQQLRELLGMEDGKAGNPAEAAKLWTEMALDAARLAIERRLARVWRSSYSGAPEQVNIDYPRANRNGEWGIIRVSIDLQSGRLLNWMVLETGPKDGWFMNWRRVTQKPDLTVNPVLNPGFARIARLLDIWNIHDIPLQEGADEQ
jgi:hypothetical protein